MLSRSSRRVIRTAVKCCAHYPSDVLASPHCFGFISNLKFRGLLPLDFKSVFVRESSNPYDLEQKIHRHFHESRIKREFFKLTEEDLALLPLICDNLLAQ
ncbi:bro21 [Heliothis virescens ascovirus 3h]|uniref:Bro21 n=1 Tax=Heliothis virescens ascovirus 3h TaxID=1268039 RepID=A0A386JAM9_9VIRU|nr:bro21 [Heliothis virescens ascovirus 3h]